MQVMTRYRFGGIFFTLFVGAGTLLGAMQEVQQLERGLGYLLVLGVISYLPAGTALGLVCGKPHYYRRPAICLYLIQLVLQCIWYPLQFSGACSKIVPVWLLVLCGISVVVFGFFFKVSRQAAYLFAGYGGWLLLMTAYIWSTTG